MTLTGEQSRFRFADLTLSVGERRVWRGRKPLQLGKLTFDFLAVLVEAWPNTVSHDELARRVWPRRVVTAENMTQRARMLRQALGDDARNPKYLAVRHGQGYQLVPEVTRIDATESWPIRRPRPYAIAAGLAVAIAFISAVSWINSGSSSTSQPLELALIDPDDTPSLERWRTALAATPDSENDLIGLGSLLCRMGEFDEGMPLLRRAVDLYPLSASALTNLANCRIAAADFTEAAELVARGQSLGDSFRLRTAPANPGFEEGMYGWSQTFDMGYRTGPNRDFEFTVDHDVARSGQASGRLESRVGTATTATISGFIPLDYLGSRVRMSVYLKTERITDEAHLWLRVDKVAPGGLEMAYFENNAYRPHVRGDTDWTRYEIVADVPDNAARIVYGFGATGSGIVWMDDLAFEVVDHSVALTAPQLEPPAPQLVLAAPENLSFEHGLHGWSTYTPGPASFKASVTPEDGMARMRVEDANINMRQDVFAREYRGKRVRLRVTLQRIAASDRLRAGVWISSGNYAQHTRSTARLWTSDGDGWQSYDAVVDVPEDAGRVTYRITAGGTGTVLVDEVGLEIVDESVPLTRPSPL